MGVTFTDIMVRVDDLAEAARALEDSLGFSEVQQGSGWRMMADPRSRQRIVLCDTDFGASWALACSRDTAKELLDASKGWRLEAPNGSAKWALLRHDAGLSVVLYN